MEMQDRGDFWQNLIRLVEQHDSSDTWNSCFQQIINEDQEPYSSIIRLLTHLEFEEAEARRHWAAIETQQKRLSDQLDRDVGLQVAALDYFFNVKSELRNPKVIEIGTFLATERNAVTDSLTGLYNRHFFDTSMRREAKRASRYGLTFSLVLLDLDNFKEVNDHYGHQAGDEALRACSDIIRESVREIDVACRYGGEEFAIILPETERAGAFIVSERIRSDVEHLFHDRTIRNGKLELSLSGGVAIFPIDTESEEELLTMADQALYRSKHDGKNRITLHADEKRTFPRFDARKTLFFRIGERDNGGEVTNETKNFSQSGALVESQVPLTVGMELQLNIKKAERTYSLKGRVVRLEEIEGGAEKRYDVGIVFLAENDEEVRQLRGLTRELYPRVS
jgi:diguanylate cyclase (GGDEF)-like protein